MKARTVLLALAACVVCFSSIAPADNLPSCCQGLSSGATSYPSTAFTYQGVQSPPDSCCSQDLAVNPNVPYTFEFTYWPDWDDSQAEATWYVIVDGPEYSFDPTDPTSAYLSTEGLAFADWSNAIYGGATEYEVGPENYIVPVDQSAAPEPDSLALIFIGFFYLAVTHRHRHSLGVRK